MSTSDTKAMSIVDRDAELAEARAVVACLTHALGLLTAADDDVMTIWHAKERAEAFMTRTEYIGEVHAEDPPLDRQVVAHAAKTLRSRASASEAGWIWSDDDWIKQLQMALLDAQGEESGSVIDVPDDDKRWIGTMTPAVGLALADLLDGKGTAATVARAVLYRPAGGEGEDDVDSDDENLAEHTRMTQERTADALDGPDEGDGQ